MQIPKPSVPVAAAALLGLFWSGSFSAGEDASRAQAPLAAETFDEVWETVHESYFDPAFGGLDWQAIRDKYRPEAVAAPDTARLRAVLNRMLGELGESHFGVIPGSEDLEQQALISENSPGETSLPSATETDQEAEKGSSSDETECAGKADAEESPSGDYSGLHLRLLKKQVVISEVDPGSPAEKAGLKAGQTVRRIGKLDVASFLAKVAEAADASFSEGFFVLDLLAGLTGAPEDGEKQVIAVTTPSRKKKKNKSQVSTHSYRPIEYPGEMSVAMGHMPPMPLRYEARRLKTGDGEVLLLRFDVFLPELMTRLREAIRKAAADEVKGIVIDLRGNPGGVGLMANGLAGLLTDEEFSLGEMNLRAGRLHFVAFPQKGAYLGPLAILVDGMSASTSEIFAAGLQEAGRARVFGRRTMGAALPSLIRELPNGDRLQHAIADLATTGGTRLEGRGVIPDAEVPFRARKRFRGADPDLDKALRWLERPARP